MNISGYNWVFILLFVVGVHWAVKKGKANARKKRLAAAGADPNLNTDFDLPQDLPPLRWLEGTPPMNPGWLPSTGNTNSKNLT